jgi:hypothetical protein
MRVLTRRSRRPVGVCPPLRVAQVLKYFSASIGGCATGSSSCLAFNTPQAVNLIDPSKVLVCTREASGVSSICYVANFAAQTATPLEFSSTAVGASGSATAYWYGGMRNGVANADAVMAVGINYVWSRTTPGAAATITTYSTGERARACTRAGAHLALTESNERSRERCAESCVMPLRLLADVAFIHVVAR